MRARAAHKFRNPVGRQQQPAFERLGERGDNAIVANARQYAHLRLIACCHRSLGK